MAGQVAAERYPHTLEFRPVVGMDTKIRVKIEKRKGAEFLTERELRQRYLLSHSYLVFV